MHPHLVSLIERFRQAQDRGVAFIIDVLDPTLGTRLPRNAGEWVAISGETGLYNVRRLNGVGVYSHGFGIELSFCDLTIDFDWGEFGEPDGFDVWRLWNFASLNPGEVPCPTYAQVKEWVESAVTAGELTRDRYLYYSPAHRTEQKVAASHAAPDSFTE